MKYAKILFVAILLFVTLQSSFFVSAVQEPINLHFENNVTSAYDEGTFSINWTAGGSSKQFFVYVSTNGGSSFIARIANDTQTGLLYTTTTHANHFFKVAAIGLENEEKNATQSISLYVDRISPTVTLIGQPSTIVKKNTDLLTLSFSVTDLNSGTTGTVCTINANGTNQTLGISGSWCNISNIVLSSLSDGNRAINIYANDTVNNLGLTNSYTLQIDTTAPTANATCSPSTINTGDSFPCTCNGADSTSGIDYTYGSSTSGSNSSTSIAGSFIYTCHVYDLAGNSANATATYDILQGSSNSSSNDTSNDTGSTDTGTGTGSETGTSSQSGSSDQTAQESGNIFTNLFGGGSNKEAGEKTTNGSATQEQPHTTFFWSIVVLIIVAIGLTSTILIKLVRTRVLPGADSPEPVPSS